MRQIPDIRHRAQLIGCHYARRTVSRNAIEAHRVVGGAAYQQSQFFGRNVYNFDLAFQKTSEVVDRLGIGNTGSRCAHVVSAQLDRDEAVLLQVFG
jgi:hypothetical protein